jgi:hypothetical protein
MFIQDPVGKWRKGEACSNPVAVNVCLIVVVKGCRPWTILSHRLPNQIWNSSISSSSYILYTRFYPSPGLGKEPPPLPPPHHPTVEKMMRSAPSNSSTMARSRPPRSHQRWQQSSTAEQPPPPRPSSFPVTEHSPGEWRTCCHLYME